MRRALALDFDGVLTTNQVWVSEDNTESVECCRSDSLGLKLLRDEGYEIIVLTAEESPVVRFRCEKMGIDFRVSADHTPQSKLDLMKEWMSDKNLRPAEVFYMGNDLNDMDCMTYPMIYPLAPQDAFCEIKLVAMRVTENKGGRGAVREVCSDILSGDLTGDLKLNNCLSLGRKHGNSDYSGSR